MSEEEEDVDIGYGSPPADLDYDKPSPVRDHAPPPASINLDYEKVPDTGSASVHYDRVGQASLKYDTPGKTGAVTARLVIALEYAYGALGLLLGLTCIVSGSLLALNGVAGSTSWTASFLGAESQLNDAAPGVVLFIVGVFLVWITKPKVKARNLP